MRSLTARYLGTPAERSRVLAIAVPAIVANSSAPLVGLVDTWAVGHLPGAKHLAAVGLGSVIFNYLLWAFGFLRMSTTGLVAQAVGRNDPLEVGRLIWRSAAMAVGLGLAMLAMQPDFGQAALVLFGWGVMWFVAGAPMLLLELFILCARLNTFSASSSEIARVSSSICPGT